MVGGEGNDTLRGSGGEDVFSEASDGSDDVIADFDTNNDLIIFSDYGSDFDTSAEVIAAATQVLADVVITFNSETLTLEGVNLADLSADDFSFI